MDEDGYTEGDWGVGIGVGESGEGLSLGFHRRGCTRWGSRKEGMDKRWEGIDLDGKARGLEIQDWEVGKIVVLRSGR